MNLFNDSEVLDEINDNIDKIGHIISPFLEIVNGKNYISFFKSYLGKIKSISEENEAKYFLDYWNHFDKSE